MNETRPYHLNFCIIHSSQSHQSIPSSSLLFCTTVCMVTCHCYCWSRRLRWKTVVMEVRAKQHGATGARVDTSSTTEPSTTASCPHRSSSAASAACSAASPPVSSPAAHQTRWGNARLVRITALGHQSQAYRQPGPSLLVPFASSLLSFSSAVMLADKRNFGLDNCC